MVNGVARLTAQSTIVPAIGGNFAVSFEANMTGFSYTSDSKTARYDGVANVVFGMTGGGNSTGLNFAIPAGKSFSTLITPYVAGKAMTAVSIEYGAGTTFAGSDAVTPNSASRKLDGSIVMSTGGAASLPLAISTRSTLSGTTTTGLFVPTSGVIATKATDENIATSTTVSGVRATVSGDTDGDGSLDLVFDSSWSALMTP